MADEIAALRGEIGKLEGKAKALRKQIENHADLRVQLRSVERALVEAHGELFRKQKD